MVLEKQLKDSVIAQNRQAQLELYNMCFDLLMNIAQRYKHNEEDKQTLVNNAFIKIVTNLGKYQEMSSFFGWVKRIVMNVVIDDFRKNKNYSELINQDFPIEAETIGNYGDIEYQHSEEALLEMIGRLPENTQHIFNLFAIDGFSHKEIAESLDIKVEASKWHMKNARKKLKAMLALQLVDERG